MSGYRNGGKRVLDILLVLTAFIGLWPLIGILYVVVRWKLGAPVFFRQIRPGFRGRPFELVKFRTMSDKRNEKGEWCADAERLSPLGKFLRASSLDELPELWNVAKGDMSLVGPRPLLMEYVPLYSEEQARRHEVFPGITGWAQVNGRNAISWDEKFVLDVWYVDHMNLVVDIRILWRTVLQLFRREGISENGHATMSKFTGSVLKEKSK